jgi:hypothetical protein
MIKKSSMLWNQNWKKLTTKNLFDISFPRSFIEIELVFAWNELMNVTFLLIYKSKFGIFVINKLINSKGSIHMSKQEEMYIRLSGNKDGWIQDNIIK